MVTPFRLSVLRRLRGPTLRRVSVGAIPISIYICWPHILSLLGQACQPFGLLYLTTIHLQVRLRFS
jgi:hypothetical protein